MGQPKSDWGFPDSRAFMDKAIESPNGWQVTFETEGQATNFRMRCYTARDRERRRNTKIYETGEPMFNSSVWHNLTFIVAKVDKRVLCALCKKDTGKEQWQLLATQGDNSLDAKCLSHGPIE